MADIWDFEPTEAQIKMAEKKWSTGQKLKLKKAILDKSSLNLFPKVEKAVFFALASMDQCGAKYRSETAGNNLFKTVLNIVKGYTGKIKNIDNIQRLLRDMYYSLVEVGGTTGKEEFKHLESSLKGTSVMGRLKKVKRAAKDMVTPKKKREKRKNIEAVKDIIGKSGNMIEEYFNNFAKTGMKMNEVDAGRLERINALMGKGKTTKLPLELSADTIINNDQFSAGLKAEILENAADYISRVNKRKTDELKMIIYEKGNMMEGYFNKFQGKESKMGTFSKVYLKQINEFLGKDGNALPIQIDENAILENKRFAVGFKVETLKNAAAYISRIRMRNTGR